jgi:cAMP phosphodiesterase
MKIQVLGCAGTISPEARTSAFLLDDDILMDGGTICSSLSLTDIEKIKTIFISHPHFDHIKGLPSLAETLIFTEATDPVTILASDMAIDAIRRHIMNDVIWPDFSRLPTKEQPVLRYQALVEGVAVKAGKLTITPYFLYNNLSDFGYLIEDGSTSLLYTSDIGATAQLSINDRVAESLIVEVSFPNEKSDLARRTGHLTPALLLEMLAKLPTLPRTVFVTHMKTYFREQIVRQLQELGLKNLVILNDGDILNL